MPLKSRGADVEMTGNEPPPATLAAQLVDNLSSQRQPRKQNDPNDYQRLLAEVRSFSNVPDGEQMDIETKVEQNQKTIFLFTRLVLEPLAKDGQPPATRQTLSTACQALQVMKKSIDESPSVLLYIAVAGSLNDTEGEVLWSWLFPRLLTFVGRDHCAVPPNRDDDNPEGSENRTHELLQSAVASFLNWVLRIASGLPIREGNLGMLLFSYLKDCTNNVLIRISDPGLIANGPLLNPKLVLPTTQPEDSVKLWNKDPGLEFGRTTYSFGDAQDAQSHAAALLLILADLSPSAAITYEPGLDYTVWTLDTMASLHDIRTKWGSGTHASNSRSNLCLTSLRSLRNMISRHRDCIPVSIECKFHMVTVKLCMECLENPALLSDDFVSEILCPSLLELASACKKFEPVSEVVKSSLLLSLARLSTGDIVHFIKHQDFKLCVRSLQGQSSTDTLAESDPSIGDFENIKLSKQVRHLDLQDESRELDSPPPGKRRKIVKEVVLESRETMLDDILSNVSCLMGSPPAEGLDGLEKVAVESFAKLTTVNQCQVLEFLGRIACSNAGTLQLVRDKDGSILEAECTICESIHLAGQHSLLVDDKICQATVDIMTNLFRHLFLVDAKRQRIVAMFALRRIVTHCRSPQFLELETSLLGQWCIKGARSSGRELRIAAGRTLPLFLRDSVDSEVLQKNRIYAIDVLRDFSEKSDIHLQETCILAWGQVGRVSVNDELNLVLLRLVEYLGHANPLVSGVAFNEISALASAQGISPQMLFEPFWRSIAVTAVKDLNTRPQTAQLMADLLAISVPDLLMMTQSYTLPWLVLSKKKQIIERITQAAGASDPWEVCINSKNLAPILAFLLVQPVADQEEFIMALMKNVSLKGFEKLQLSDLIKTAPIEIAFELLNASGDADESKKSRTRYALQFLASQCGGTSSSKQAKKTSLVGPFLEQHILGLVTYFSDAINDIFSWHPAAEKRRCIKGIEETIQVGKSYIVSALPQICALLQSALMHKDLRTTALFAWAAMVKVLDNNYSRTILESTYAVIIQHWQDFESVARQCAGELVEYLHKDCRDLIEECFDVLPSLASIPSLAVYETELKTLSFHRDIRHSYQILIARIGHENHGVVAQALLDLAQFLRKQQSFLQVSAVSEQPDAIVGKLLRSVLDSCRKFSDSNPDIARLSAECIGLVGCLDPNRVEAVRERREMVVVSNFDQLDDTIDFILFALEHVLVKAFLSATSSKAQNLLSFAMQDLLEKCNIKEIFWKQQKPGDQSETTPVYRKWLALPDPVRATLTPFLRSKYLIREMRKFSYAYPIFQSSMKYSAWLRSFVLDLLQKAQNSNASLIFESFTRIIRIQDTSPAAFLLPYVVLHVVVSGTMRQSEEIFQELYTILTFKPVTHPHHERETIQLYNEAVFRVLDYIRRWVQEKKSTVGQLIASGGHESTISSAEEGMIKAERMLAQFPAELISQRAIQCKSFARALFHWEAHIREAGGTAETPTLKADAEKTAMLERLQQIYTQIDEPDGIEGIAANLHVLNIDHQIIGHRKAGRWTAAQPWYEIKLNEDPANVGLQLDLLTCLKESGQHDALLKYVEGLHQPVSVEVLPYAAEASWVTGNWDVLSKYLNILPLDPGGDFNVTIGHLLGALRRNDIVGFTTTIADVREKIGLRLSGPTSDSLRACHDPMLCLHVITDLEMIAGTVEENKERGEILESLRRRLEVVGAHPNDKQYLLGIRRAAMQLVSPRFTKLDVASAWLQTAKLARKGNSIPESHNAVLRALHFGDESAAIEQARLLWKEGHARQAIQILRVATEEFISHNRTTAVDTGADSNSTALIHQQNLTTATAQLLLAKWLDSAGQTQANTLRTQYQLAAKTHPRWEKGHYYLGRHYNKLFESEKNLLPEQQSHVFLEGQTAKLVIENYFRSLDHGNKYIYQTLPRILTLWLDLGDQVLHLLDKKRHTPEFIQQMKIDREKQLSLIHQRIGKCLQKLPAYKFYTALPQIVARIAHKNAEVVKFLQKIIVKVVNAHPQQALWSLLAICTSMQSERQSRGKACLETIRRNNASKQEPGRLCINTMILRGARLTEQLLNVCHAGDFPGNRASRCSITRDLRFQSKGCVPNDLAVPIESTLTATLPTKTGSQNDHRAFSGDVITISSFDDSVLVLGSLAKPRKLLARGSDGRCYGLLCKPKDDLRKDQRLMEFNSMINRSLKRDAESSKRQLYIKTYAVTPLNEECGIIEWVDGLKTFRDIVLELYKAKSIVPNYAELKMDLDAAAQGGEKLKRFKVHVLDRYPPVFHSWFVQLFPEPSAWFAARLKYTRSAAVMSMVGTILGLGDRHTENILIEEGNGGIFHVDFNCLFDKGLTFAQPELVPFRLTHNMVDAMGVYKYEGPFRKSSELTLGLLRQHQETLMTILESFLHDPTLDLLKKKKKESVSAVPDTPQAVLDSVKKKIDGLLAGEQVPLGVEGQVDELIKQAIDHHRLSQMYIGWCAFL